MRDLVMWPALQRKVGFDPIVPYYEALAEGTSFLGRLLRAWWLERTSDFNKSNGSGDPNQFFVTHSKPSFGFSIQILGITTSFSHRF